jgi:uncharacterized protein (TIGR03118 family)
VTNDQLANPATLTDSHLENAWGLAESPTSPFWVGDNGTGVSTLYAVNPLTNATTIAGGGGGLVVTIPGDGSVTGVAFNSGAATGAFNGDNFLFVSEDGTISGWRGALGTTAEILQTASALNVYKGTAVATIGTNSYIYAANFRSGVVDVLKSTGAPNLTGNFTDPALPSGYAPFNVKVLNGVVFVTYALQDLAKKDDVAGLGNGFVSEFDLQGNFIGRIASQGTLDSPWGLAVAPLSFGSLAGDLLVGNFGSGTIDAFNILTHSFDGQLMDINNSVITIDGLWALSTGNNGNGGSTQKLYFTAGPNEESDGLFGVIYVPEPFTLSLFGAGLAGTIAIRRRRKKAD